MARPRKYPEGTTAAQRKAIRYAALVASGGATLNLDLSPDLASRLDAIKEEMGVPSRTATIERLIAEREPGVRKTSES